MNEKPNSSTGAAGHSHRGPAPHADFQARPMRAGEDLLRLLFESSLDAVLLVSLDGEVLAANPAVETVDAFISVVRPG